jgi:hypothetical protein
VQRKRIAQKLGNPRLNNITFHISPLESYDGICKNKRHFICNAVPRSQKHQKTLLYTQLIKFEKMTSTVLQLEQATKQKSS